MFLFYCTSVCICYHVAVFVIPFDMQHDNVLKKLNLTFLPPGPWGSAGEIFATTWLHLWFHLIWYATWTCLIKLILTPTPGSGGSRRGSEGKIFVTTFRHSRFYLIWYAIWPCSEKSWILTFDPRVRGWEWAGFCGQNICYQIAAFIFPFNLICNMIMFWKSWILTVWHHPSKSNQGVWHRVWSKIAFDMFLIYCNSVWMRNFSKKYWQLTELLRNLHIWYLIPLGEGGR